MPSNLFAAQIAPTCKPETWVSVVVPSLRHAADAGDALLLLQLPLMWLPSQLGTSVAVASCAASLASDTEAMVAYAASYPCHTDQAYEAASYWLASSWEAAQTWDLNIRYFVVNK